MISLPTALALQYLNGNLKCFQDYKLLAEWLGCYQYALPDKRQNIPEELAIKVMVYLMRTKHKDSTRMAAYRAWEFILLCEHLNTEVLEELSWTLG